jgi:hypothetical protein
MKHYQKTETHPINKDLFNHNELTNKSTETQIVY